MALDYHRFPIPGKITVEPSKPLTAPTDLALAYSPGVAAGINLEDIKAPSVFYVERARAVSPGPILMGVRKPAHVLTPTATVRRVANMTPIAAVDAQRKAGHQQTEIDGL